MPLADARTLEALDFAALRERVAGATQTQRGRALAALLAPLDDFAGVCREQRRTEAMRALRVRSDFHVLPAGDTAAHTQAAQLGRTLAPGDLRLVADALAAAAAAVKAVREEPELAPVAAPHAPLRELQRSILDAVDERGVILDRASPALARLRRSLAQAQAEARDRIGRILTSAKYAKAIQDRVVTIRAGRFVIPIKSEFAGAVAGIVHDTSASGQTLFVEPLESLESNNRVRTLQSEEEREVQRVLRALSESVGAAADQIEANVSALAQLDLVAARASLAQAQDARMPEMSEQPCVVIERGRHPLLGARAVPQSLALDERTRLLVISGPNMGGKTVALKMTGLFVVMAYCGLQLPAAHARVGRFERVVADIGDAQSLAEDTSTFAAHLERLRDIIEAAGPQTLAVVDEIGGGTEPSAGAALALAILERLLRTGAKAIVSTHSTEVKLFAHASAGVANASVRFDPQSFSPTFELDVGAPGQSLAFALAERMGIAEEIVRRAGALLDDRERDYEAALSELAQRNAELREERARLERERGSVEAQRALLERERAELEAQRRRFAAGAEERLAQSLRDFVRELQRRAEATESVRTRRARATPAQSELLAKTIAAIRSDLGIRPEQNAQSQAQRYVPGDRVRVLSLDQSAVVAEDWDERLLVSIGSMKMTVERGDVRREAGAPERARAAGTNPDARANAAARASLALDVRGQRYAQAEPLVERWIDDALLAGSSPLRLIHGKGTGMLGRGLQAFLRAHPAVTSLRYGTEEEGSTGVTIVELRS